MAGRAARDLAETSGAVAAAGWVYGTPGTGGAGGFGGGGGDGIAGPEGAGGEVFVQQGGSLTIKTGVLDGGSVIPGAGGTSGAGGGAAYGSGIFVQGNNSVTLAPASGQALTINDVIADQGGSGGSGPLVIDGSGIVDLTAANAYNGDTVLQAGTLALGTITSAGGGTITFAPSSDATLVFDAASPPTNVIAGFRAGDRIILPDFTYAVSDTYTVNAATLDLNGVAGASASIQLVGDQDETFVLGALTGSPGAGIIVTVAPPAAPTALTLAPASDSGVQGDDITNDTMPQITGLGISGETITLYDGTIDAGSGTVASNGAWAITTGPLSAGVHQLSATQTDSQANVSTASGTLTVTIDTAVPAAPSGLLLLAPTDSGTLGDDITSFTTLQIGGSGVIGDTITLYAGTVEVGTGTVSGTGQWGVLSSTLAPGVYAMRATQSDVAGNVSTISSALSVTIEATPGVPAGLTLAPASDVVDANQSYQVVSPPNDAGDTVARVFDPVGVLDEIDTRNAQSLLLTAVTNTQAVIEIYDNAGNLIGTITQPSTAATSQPIFSTAGATLSATTGSGPVGSNIDLLAESNVITSQGNDTITAGPGADTVHATGQSTSIQGGSGTLVFVAGSGSSTVSGGAGVSTLFGGADGGYLQGGRGGLEWPQPGPPDRRPQRRGTGDHRAGCA